MPFLDGFKAFRANRRLHYHIQNAAICCVLFASVVPWFWPKLELASRTVAVIALLVLSAKILFQPEVICRIPEMKFEYVRGVRNKIVHFPRLYIAHTGSSFSSQSQPQLRIEYSAGYLDRDGRPEVGVYADQDIDSLRYLFEYSLKVMTSFKFRKLQ